MHVKYTSWNYVKTYKIKKKKKNKKLFKPVKTVYNERVAELWRRLRLQTGSNESYGPWSEAHMHCFWQEAQDADSLVAKTTFFKIFYA